MFNCIYFGYDIIVLLVIAYKVTYTNNIIQDVNSVFDFYKLYDKKDLVTEYNLNLAFNKIAPYDFKIGKLLIKSFNQSSIKIYWFYMQSVQSRAGRENRILIINA